jgi:osmotically-inducible protein OsmY
MSNAEKIVEMIRTAIEHTRAGLRHHSIKITVNDDGTVVLDGEVPELAAKKLALEAAATVPHVSGIVDRLRVSPVERRGDGEIRDHVRGAISGDTVFLDHEIRTEAKPTSDRYAVSITTKEGVVTLDGVVASLSHKRLAGVLAWWAPGTRDVINGLEVDPPEQDNDDEIVEALRLVFEKDPLVNAHTVQVASHDSIVTLSGIAANEKERSAAEHDAWCVFGVNKVINQLVVR